MHINYHISDISSLFATTNCKIFIFYILKDLIIYSLQLSLNIICQFIITKL